MTMAYNTHDRVLCYKTYFIVLLRIRIKFANPHASNATKEPQSFFSNSTHEKRGFHGTRYGCHVVVSEQITGTLRLKVTVDH